MPAPKNNLYAVRNGTRISRLTLGELPARMQRQLQNVRKYRRYLEELALEKHGEVNDEHAHIIDEACKWETHASFCRSLMRERFAKMSTGELMMCSKEIANATSKRNVAVRLLNLNAPPESPWNIVDGKATVASP